MNIKVLGTGCPSCIKLEKHVKKAIEGTDITVEKVTDISEIMAYGVLGTPALVIDEKVVSTGKVNSIKEIKELIKK